MTAGSSPSWATSWATARPPPSSRPACARRCTTCGPRACSGPTELLARINRTVLDLFPEYFLTACCCLIDTAGTLTCAVAGHPPLLVRSPEGEVDAILSHSLPLGVAARPEVSEHALAFGVGSSVVVYSDGVSDTLADGPRLGGDAVAEVLRGVPSGAPRGDHARHPPGDPPGGPAAGGRLLRAGGAAGGVRGGCLRLLFSRDAERSASRAPSASRLNDTPDYPRPA